MNFKRMLLTLAAALALAACGKSGERVFFEGNYYPADLASTGEGREAFAVTVQDATQGIEGAREAGRFEATRYCIENYGDSDITWQQGYGVEDARAMTDRGSLIMRGSCVIW